ncbi:MAG: hypothetical protein KatS3mg045_1911 [Bellilinea sp.]|nr:MAG: hypothetical protein KatS3mg045_1911 [Bellilinea sp.]
MIRVRLNTDTLRTIADVLVGKEIQVLRSRKVTEEYIRDLASSKRYTELGYADIAAAKPVEEADKEIEVLYWGMIQF